MPLTIFFYSIFASFGLPELNRTALANAATASEHSHDILTFMFPEISCNAMKLKAECSLEMGGQSEDKQSDCLSKNASYFFIL